MQPLLTTKNKQMQNTRNKNEMKYSSNQKFMILLQKGETHTNTDADTLTNT